MARRIRDAAALGCRWMITETGEDLPQQPNPSYHNMLRTGFLLSLSTPQLPERINSPSLVKVLAKVDQDSDLF